MPKVDIEAAAVCSSFNSLCTDQLGDLAGAKVFREVDNLVESKSTSAQEMADDHASNMQKEGLDEPGLLPCPSFTSYVLLLRPSSRHRRLKVSGEFDDDFTFDIPKWGHKFFFGSVFPVFNRDNILLEQFESSQRDLEAMEEKSKSTTGTASPARTKLSELFEQVDGRSFVIPTSTTSNKTKRSSSAYDWKLRDVARRTNSEGATMSLSRSSKKKKPQRRSWVDRCIGHMLLCFSSS